MREIKFRAWDGKRILDDFYVSCRSGKAEVRGEVFDWTLMQYTGLKDKKNGKEIYEGDIVKQGEEVYWVAWKFNRWVYAGRGETNNVQAEGNLDDDCKVIGNIYESPNLLNT
jgi:hypothetical protein